MYSCGCTYLRMCNRCMWESASQYVYNQMVYWDWFQFIRTSEVYRTARNTLLLYSPPLSFVLCSIFNPISLSCFLHSFRVFLSTVPQSCTFAIFLSHSFKNTSFTLTSNILEAYLVKGFRGCCEIRVTSVTLGKINFLMKQRS